MMTFLVVAPSTAEAYCTGVNSNAVIDRTWGRERVKWATTCDGKLDYYGQVNDRLTDGYCVRAEYTVAAVWTYSNYECTTGNWTDFTYVDDDGHSWIRICRSAGGGCTVNYTNTGF